MGPSALRIAGLNNRIRQTGREVVEMGAVTATGPEVSEVGDPQARYLQEIRRVAEQTRKLVRAALAAGRLPLVLGGDHSLSMGSAAGTADHYRGRGQEIGLIWVDAHTDMNRPSTSPSGNVHGMPLAVLLGRGHSALIERGPQVKPGQVCVLAAREIDPGERRLIRELGVRVFTMSEIDDRGLSTCMDEALERVTAGTAGFHLSLDLDALDPRLAPGVGTPVRGGLTYREGHLVCEKAARSGGIVSLDMVELNPVLDSGNVTADLGVGLIASALGKRIL